MLSHVSHVYILKISQVYFLKSILCAKAYLCLCILVSMRICLHTCMHVYTYIICPYKQNWWLIGSHWHISGINHPSDPSASFPIFPLHPYGSIMCSLCLSPERQWAARFGPCPGCIRCIHMLAIWEYFLQRIVKWLIVADQAGVRCTEYTVYEKGHWSLYVLIDKQRAAGDVKWLKLCPAFDRLQFIATSITAFLPTLGIATSTVSKAGIKSNRGSTSRISSDVRRTKPSCTSSDVPRCSNAVKKRWKGWGSRSESLLIVHCSKTLQECLLRDELVLIKLLLRRC